MLSSRFVAGVLLAGTMALGAGAMSGQEYPNRPIRFIVPYPPGGATTHTARLVAQKLAEAWGQNVVIDNRGGAATVVGTELAARAAPDGYTLLLANFGWAVTPGLHDKLPYDVVRDFSPISLIANGSLALLVHPAVPAQSVKDLVALAKARPGQLNYGSSGGGSSSNLGTLLFQSMTGVRMTGITYRGGGPLLIALLSGELQVVFVSISAAMPHITAGKLRVLGVSSPKRTVALPDVPTIAEAGIDGYELVSWYGVAVPAGTPQPIISKLNGEVVRAVESADVQKALIAQGLDPASSSPAEFSRYVAGEVAKWAKLIKETRGRRE
ncbi:MAG: tripartite tricarboxylate transporter substrate binding protein [Betaproteobacteria bacterium]|nr:tripartite tricarboxylate transporter substrate binding protein [Betaproteobacteria bacterium]